MSVPKLKLQPREGSGRRYVKKMRSEGFTPCVVYGHNKETTAVKVDSSELGKFLSRYGKSGSVDVEFGGKQIQVIIKEIQRGVIENRLLHVDFQQLSAGEKIKMTVPIHLIGREKVENATTILQQQLNELDIQCLPKDIPSTINVDVSHLEIGNSLQVGDLEIAKDNKIEILNDISEIVASLTSATREETSEDEDEVPIYESTKSILDN